MDFIKFEDTLGKPIDDVELTMGFNLKEHNSKDNQISFYRNDQDISFEYFGLVSRFISVQSNESNAVKSISIHFREVINRKFYERFLEKYGEPDNIHVISKRTVISEGQYEKDDFSAYLTKSEIDFREGTFDKKPLFIIWNKDGYQIKAFLRHQQNISEITFSLQD